MEPLILLVDDQPDFLEIFGTKLKSVGFRVATANGGDEGFARAKELKPALVLPDMQMPGLNGADVLGKLLDDPDTKGCKVAFLTNLGGVSPEEKMLSNRVAQESGAVGYIKKTDDLDGIVQRVKALIDMPPSPPKG